MMIKVGLALMALSIAMMVCGLSGQISLLCFLASIVFGGASAAVLASLSVDRIERRARQRREARLSS